MLTRKSKSPSCANISIGFPPPPEKSRLLPKEDSGRLLLTSLSTTPGSCELSSRRFSRVLHPKRRERLFSWLMMLSWAGEGSRSSVFFFRSLKSSRNRKRAAYHALKSGVNKNTSKINHWTGNQRLHIISSFYGLVLSRYIPWALHVDLAIIFGPTLLKFNESKKSAWTEVSKFLDVFFGLPSISERKAMPSCLRPRTGGSEQDLAVHVKSNNFSCLFHCATWVKRHILHSTCLGIPTSTLYGLCLACGVRVRRLPNIHKRCRTAYGERMWRNFRVTELKKCRVK